MLKGQFLTKNTPIMRKDVRIEAKGRVFEPIGVAVHQAYSTPHASVFTASLLPGAPHPPKRGEDARAQESRQRRRWGGVIRPDYASTGRLRVKAIRSIKPYARPVGVRPWCS